ncbi:hypothetical protein KJ813_04090 [bacterium]|nr:hypothetical protein [bacterium]
MKGKVKPKKRIECIPILIRILDILAKKKKRSIIRKEIYKSYGNKA